MSALADIRCERRNSIPARMSGGTRMGRRRSRERCCLREPSIEMTGIKAIGFFRELRTTASALADIRYEQRNSIPARMSRGTRMGWGQSAGHCGVLSPGIEMTGIKAIGFFRELRTTASALADIRYEQRNSIPARMSGGTRMGRRRSAGHCGVLSPGIEMTGIKAIGFFRELRTTASALADIRYERRNSIPARMSGGTRMGWGQSAGHCGVLSPGIEMTGLKAAVLSRELRTALSALADIGYERRNSIPARAWRTAI